MLADVACTAPAAAPAVPPEARSHLASVLGSYADDSNTCAAPCAVVGVVCHVRPARVSLCCVRCATCGGSLHLLHADILLYKSGEVAGAKHQENLQMHLTESY